MTEQIDNAITAQKEWASLYSDVNLVFSTDRKVLLKKQGNSFEPFAASTIPSDPLLIQIATTYNSIQEIANSLVDDIDLNQRKRLSSLLLSFIDIAEEQRQNIIESSNADFSDITEFFPPSGVSEGISPAQNIINLTPATPSSPTTIPSVGGVTNTSPTPPTGYTPPVSAPSGENQLARPCGEANGVIMSSPGGGTYYFKLLPAQQYNLPMQGSSDAPNALPGLHFRIIPNVARLKIPGYAPVFQHLGIDSVVITMVGTFIGDDKLVRNEDPGNIPYTSGLQYPSSTLQELSEADKLKTLTNSLDSYKSATEFYRWAVVEGKELDVVIRVNNYSEPGTGEDNSKLRDGSSKNPKFKGIIRSMELYHSRHDRTWYTIQMEVSDFGMYSNDPLNLNSDINAAIESASAEEAIQDEIDAEEEARVNPSGRTNRDKSGFFTGDEVTQDETLEDYLTNVKNVARTEGLMDASGRITNTPPVKVFWINLNGELKEIQFSSIKAIDNFINNVGTDRIVRLEVGRTREASGNEYNYYNWYRTTPIGNITSSSTSTTSSSNSGIPTVPRQSEPIEPTVPSTSTSTNIASDNSGADIIGVVTFGNAFPNSQPYDRSINEFIQEANNNISSGLNLTTVGILKKNGGYSHTHATSININGDVISQRGLPNSLDISLNDIQQIIYSSNENVQFVWTATE